MLLIRFGLAFRPLPTQSLCRWITNFARLAILVSIANVPALAGAAACESLFSPSQKAAGIEVLGPARLHAADYENLVKSVDALIGNLEPATEVSIRIVGPGGVANYNNSLAKPLIEISSAFHKHASGKSNHPKYSLAILAHEYGHALFDKNMQKRSPFWGQLVEAQRLLATRAQSHEQKRQLDEIMKVVVAYHELFADIVAVVRFQDPRIIADSFSGEGSKTLAEVHENRKIKSAEFARTYIEDRRFDRPWGSAHWKQWEQDVKKARAETTASSPYLLLAPARAAFWSLASTKIQSPASQKQVISDAFSILQSHFDNEFSKLNSIDELNPTEFNRSLIKAFEEK